MRIKSLYVKNYKCIGNDGVKLDFSSNIIVLIGENNSGKSAILEALNLFLSGSYAEDGEYYNHKTDKNNGIVIEIVFYDLTDEDKEHQAVKSNYFEDESISYYRVRKVYYQEEKSGKRKNNYDADALNKDGEKIISNPGGYASILNDLFTEDKMQKVYLPAVRDLTDEIKINSKSKSSFQQVFDLVVGGQLSLRDEYKALKEAYEKYIKLFDDNDKTAEVKDLENKINEKLGRIFPAVSKIVISPAEETFYPDPLILTNDKKDIDVEPKFQGHGLQRALIFSLLELLAEHTSPPTKTLGVTNLLLIEEPEIYMHPQMERKIADTLYKIAEEKGAQVICVTHSPSFIRYENLENTLYRLHRKDDEVKVSCLPGVKEDSREELKSKLRTLSNFDPTVNEIFFAKRVVLIEGDTELAFFREAPLILDLLQSPEDKHKYRDTTFVNCRGKWTILHFQEVMNSFEIEYVVVHDKDGEENATLQKANDEIFARLKNGEADRKMIDTKIEDLLDVTGSPTKDKPLEAIKKLRDLTTSHSNYNEILDLVKFAYNFE